MIAAFSFGPTLLLRERYGPPPGNYRALSEREMGNRGWADSPRPYEANTASSISALMLRA